MAIKNFNDEFHSSAFQMNSARLIEASAGTGKTYNIQSLYARLIMEKGLKVSQIQVMTYTEAATKELRDRLHAILKDVYARLCGQECQEEDAEKRKKRNDRADELIQYIPQDAKDQACRNAGMALLEFDQCAISTIHGFCQRILSRYAFDAGINFASDIENNKTSELNSLADDWWRSHSSEIPEKAGLSTLKTFMAALSEKTDYDITEENTSGKQDADGFILRKAQELVQKYKDARQESPTMTFDDLILFVRNAIKKENPRSGQLISKLREEYKAALIDEFQDTDPAQYEIFERIFLDGNPNPLFFVGDPKQAIYSFRGGDIFTYLKAKEHVKNQSCLTVNYRSTKKLMESINKMFMDSPDGNTFEHEQITYSSEATVEKNPFVKGELLDKPFKIITFTPQKDGKPSFSSDMPQILEHMTAEILQILSQKNEQGKPVFSPGDIAILVNSNLRSRDIHQRLMQARIPSVVQKSGNVFSSALAKELWLFLLAVANPTDRKKIFCALTTVFFKNPVSNVSDIDNLKEIAGYINHFTALNSEWNMHGLAALVASLENDGYRKRLAKRPDGERHLSDISQIWEMCFSAVKQVGPSPEKLVNWLAERINGSADSESESEEYSRELETDEDAVRIMTVHASKGLAARIVFLPDVWNISRKQYKPYNYHDAGKTCFSLSENAKERGKQEQYQEKIRLLYVAMTRAIERMILFTPPADTIQDEPLYKLLTNLEARRGENPPYEITSVSAAECNGKYDPPEQDVSLKDAKKPPEIKTFYCKRSFSSMFGKKNKDDDDRDIDNLTERAEMVSDKKSHPIFQIPGGAAIGTCWHNILEKVPFNADETEIRKIAEEELTVGGLMENEGIPDSTTDMILKTLHFNLHSPDGITFSLSDVSWSNRLSEQEFNVSYNNLNMNVLKDILQKHWKNDVSKQKFLEKLTMDNIFPEGFLNGFIDLIFQHNDYFYIIDWKSNTIGGKRESFTQSDVIGEMAKHLYFCQYLLYSVILHFYLKQTLGSRYSWARNFGGIRYCFLRGIAAGGEAPVFEDRPSEKMLDELGIAFGLTEKE